MKKETIEQVIVLIIAVSAFILSGLTRWIKLTSTRKQLRH